MRAAAARSAVAAAELQRQRVLLRDQTQQPRAVAAQDGGRGDHLGVQQRVGEKPRRK